MSEAALRPVTAAEGQRWSQGMRRSVLHDAIRETAVWREATSSFCARQIDAKYKALACILMAFEKKWYSAWLEPVEATITAHLKQPLLREDTASKKCALSFQMKLLIFAWC